MVLVPEVLAAIKPIRDVPAAAGGVMNGRQMAACMAMGAAGVSRIGLAGHGGERDQRNLPRKMIEASSRDAVAREKPDRQTGASAALSLDEAALPMPLEMEALVSENALRSVEQSAAAGNEKARDMVTWFVGQGVGLIDPVRSAGQVVQEFKLEFAEAVEHASDLVSE